MLRTLILTAVSGSVQAGAPGTWTPITGLDMPTKNTDEIGRARSAKWNPITLRTPIGGITPTKFRISLAGAIVGSVLSCSTAVLPGAFISVQSRL